MSASRRFPAAALLVVMAACGGTGQVSPPLHTPADASAESPADASAKVPTDPSTEAPANAPANSPAASVTPYVAADAHFMRNMIGHHAQAIDMASLVPDRSRSEVIALLARRIDESQVYEIGLMQRWLAARGEPGGNPADADMAGMAGMATPEQLAELADAEGEAFDKLFLELMTRHHEGALVMVDDLLSAEGGGQEPELFVLISHVDADQRAEIARMRRMLNALQ